MGAVIPKVQVEFCGEYFTVLPDAPFRIGREADLVVDDENLHLHRNVVELSWREPIWWIANVGSRMSVTVAESESRVHAFLQPGAQLPLVFEETAIRFTAGATTYEVTVHLEDSPFETAPISIEHDGTTTLGRVHLTPDQTLLVLALAEPALRLNGSGSTSLPSSAEAAQRLGWQLTKFNRKLDNVCQKLKKSGVRGLHGEAGQLASLRRARLVEYAISVGLVGPDDLWLLDEEHSRKEQESSV